MEGLAVGRIVHFRQAGECQAAIVAKVHGEDGLVNLAVVNPNGSVGPFTSIKHGDGAFEWHWPERA